MRDREREGVGRELLNADAALLRGRHALWRASVMCLAAFCVLLGFAAAAYAKKCPVPQGGRATGTYATADGSGQWELVRTSFSETEPGSYSFTANETFTGSYLGYPEELTATNVTGTLRCGVEALFEELSGTIGGMPVSETVTSRNEYTATEVLNGQFTNNYGETGTYSGTILQEPPVITSWSPAAGPGGGGTSLKIHGRFLQNTTSVIFGSPPFATAASPSYAVNAAGTLLTAVTPPSPTAGGPGTQITVSTPGGTASTGANVGFVYMPPQITKVTPDSGPSKGGTLVTIKGKYFANLSSLSFDGLISPGSYTINPSGTQIKLYTPAGTPGAAGMIFKAGETLTVASGFFTYTVPTITSVTPNTGPAMGGTKVTIVGKHLSEVSGANGVEFGDVPAVSYTVSKGGTSIAADAPAHSDGTVDIHLNTPDGEASSVTSGDQFTFLG
jgi:hypothetical protein